MSKLLKFIKTYEVSKGEPYTHTSLNKDTSAGKYFIPKTKLNKFFDLYFEHTFLQNKDIHLSEKHPDSFSKICIDIDLRYNSSEVYKRYYQDNEIIEFVKLYQNIIKENCPGIEEERLIAYIFEKENGKIEGEVFKDGIHIMFPFIPIKYSAQYLFRNKLLEKLNKEKLFKKCITDNENIFDKSVIEKNNWILLGGKKESSVPYKLTKIIDNNLEMLEIPEPSVDLIKTISIIDQKEEINYNEKVVDFKKSSKISKVNNGNNENFIKSILNIVSLQHCEEYSSWLLVGAALYNTSDTYLDIWKEWSSKSEKYDEFACDKLWNETFPNYKSERKATIGSIKKIARESNQQEYLKILEKYGVDDKFYSLLKEGMSNTHYDSAKILYHLFSSRYKYSNDLWFVFENNRWKQTKDPINLRKSISTDLINHFLSYNIYITNKAYQYSTEGDEKNRDLYLSLSEQCKKVIKGYKNSTNKNSIINECKELFYDDEFFDKLDTNIYLLGFNNGVYELNKGIFRKAQPDDNISFSCNYDYERNIDDSIRNDIMNLIDRIIPDNDIRDFVLMYFASTLVGTNKNELFLNFEGTGGNGKGVITTLHDYALGDYSGTLNNNYLVNTFNSPESHNTMLANNYKKRYLQVNEPANTKQLNINLIKELTGGDRIQLRVAHSSETRSVEPLFKLCMLFNELPKIENTKDGGFIRRFIGVNCPNKFVDREPKKKNEYRQDPNIKQKIKNSLKWKQQYMLILFDYLKKYMENNEILRIPEVIKNNSKRLLNEQDPIQDFINSNLIITGDKNDILRKSELWEEYRSFYKENYPDKLKCGSSNFIEKLKMTLPNDVEYKSTIVRNTGNNVKKIPNIFSGIRLNYESDDFCAKSNVDF